MILDPSGGLVWFKPLPRYTSATNFRVQEYAGKPVLTWWQGDISVHGFGHGRRRDRRQRLHGHRPRARGQRPPGRPARVPADAAGHGADHLLLPDPLQPLLGRRLAPTAAVTDGVFQEIDVQDGPRDVRMDQPRPRGAGRVLRHRPTARRTAYPFDFFHINSINLDRDGSLLISARNTWTVYDLDAATRPDPLAARRQAARASSRRAGDTHGLAARPARTARRLDQHLRQRLLADRAPAVARDRPAARPADAGRPRSSSQLTHTPALVVESQGNVQALANGDWFLGWGQEPFFSEFSPTAQLLFDAHFPPTSSPTAASASPGSGTPDAPPGVRLPGRLRRDAGTVYASWNGATQVASWRVLRRAPRRDALHADR